MIQEFLLKIAIQYGVYALIALGAVGGFAGYGMVKYNQGWNAAIAGVASRQQGVLNEVRGAVSKADDCTFNGGFWDTTGGVCR